MITLKKKESNDPTKVNLNIEEVLISSIKLWKDNPRKNDSAAPKLAEVFKARGQINPIVVWRKNMTCYGGNTRIKAAKLLGWTKIKVLFADFPSETAAIAYGIADNKSSEWAEWDDSILRSFMLMPEVAKMSSITVDENQSLFAAPGTTTKPNRKTEKDEVVLVGSLKPNPLTYRAHPADQIEHMVKSIELCGIYRPILISRDSVIIDGHAIVIAAKKIGLVSVPVKRLDVLATSPEALKIMACGNETSKLAEVDDRKLSEYLKKVKDTAKGGLKGSGYDEMMLANLAMITRPASEIKNQDAAAEWVGMPDYENVGEPIRLVVSFRSKEDRLKFVANIKLEILKKQAETWSTWWPNRVKDDVKAVKFNG